MKRFHILLGLDGLQNARGLVKEWIRMEKMIQERLGRVKALERAGELPESCFRSAVGGVNLALKFLGRRYHPKKEKIQTIALDNEIINYIACEAEYCQCASDSISFRDGFLMTFALAFKHQLATSELGQQAEELSKIVPDFRMARS